MEASVAAAARGGSGFSSRRAAEKPNRRGSGLPWPAAPGPDVAAGGAVPKIMAGAFVAPVQVGAVASVCGGAAAAAVAWASLVLNAGTVDNVGAACGPAAALRPPPGAGVASNAFAAAPTSTAAGVDRVET